MQRWLAAFIAILLTAPCLFPGAGGSLVLRGTVARTHAVRIVVCPPGRLSDPVAVVSGWVNAGAAFSVTLSSSNPDFPGYSIVRGSMESGLPGGGSWIAAAACPAQGAAPSGTLTVSIAAR